MSNALTPDQLAFFAETGYLIIENAFDADEVLRMRADADAIRDELAALDVVLTDSPDGTTWRVETRA